MTNMLKQLFILVCAFSLSASAQGKDVYKVKSPNGKLSMELYLGRNMEYAVLSASDTLVRRSPISLRLVGGTRWGADAKVVKLQERIVNDVINTPVYKKATVHNHCNELALRMKGDYSLILRVYDEGVAYRFVSHGKKPFKVESEQAVFNFPEDVKVHVAYVPVGSRDTTKQFNSSFENTYEHANITEWTKNRLAILPLVAETKDGKKICITEADLHDYPGMYLFNSEGKYSLKGMFAPYPKTTAQGERNVLTETVKATENYIARYNSGTAFPWRAVIVADKDAELLNNDMVYKLATPAKGDFSWVKPGKVAWDWWNNWNLSGVDFVTGINNETYRHYIDFAARHGIEYVILDEGWAVAKKADLMQVVPEINLLELVKYASQKGVGLLLWAGYYAFNKDIEGVCKHYAAMGIKGFKVDFMDRDDQKIVAFHSKVAAIAAKYGLLIDFHGTYKPTGLQCTYPNVISFEGVHGLEHMKWSDTDDQVTYDVTAPFIRMVAGPMDYTPGAMRNAVKANYRAIRHEPMSQGTRTRQLALYVVFESPLSMLCDSPTSYEQEAECTRFIAGIPTVWDETKALDGKIAEHIAIARRKGNDWYVATLTNWEPRTMELDLSFLGSGEFVAELFKDGVNADKVAKDYVREVVSVPANKRLPVSMAAGGGCVMKISKK